jgi:hypothetical protein
LLAIADDLGELFLEFTLFVQEQLRVTDRVHEQDVADLQLNICFGIYSHISSAVNPILKPNNSGGRTRCSFIARRQRLVFESAGRSESDPIPNDISGR